MDSPSVNQATCIGTDSLKTVSKEQGRFGGGTRVSPIRIISGAFSKTVTLWPLRRDSIAQARPPRPAPTIMMWIPESGPMNGYPFAFDISMLLLEVWGSLMMMADGPGVN